MRLLLDTHLLLWSISNSARLSRPTYDLIGNSETSPFFSVVSLWEVVIKRARDKEDFKVDATVLRQRLLENGYLELPILSEHVIAVSKLPLLHKDSFDRLLIAQATIEKITLLTGDPQIARYPGPIRKG